MAPHFLLQNSMKASLSLRDTLSSGIHSWNSQTDGQSFSWNNVLSRSRHTDTPSCFNGESLLLKSAQAVAYSFLTAWWCPWALLSPQMLCCQGPGCHGATSAPCRWAGGTRVCIAT